MLLELDNNSNNYNTPYLLPKDFNHKKASQQQNKAILISEIQNGKSEIHIEQRVK